MEKELLIETSIETENKKELAKQVLFSHEKIEEDKTENFQPAISLFDEKLTENLETKEENLAIASLPESVDIETIEEDVSVEQNSHQETFVEPDIKSKEEVEIKSEKVKISQTKPKQNLKTRLKIAFVAVVLVLTCLSGWAIYNGVRVKTLTSQLQAKNTEYSINVAKVISNISKLDDLSNPNSITNLDELEKAEVIKIIPKEDVAPISYEAKSNWFDRVCNWLSNLFK